MAGLGTRVTYSEYSTALLDRRFEDCRIGQEEAPTLTKTALELALTTLLVTQLTRQNSPHPMVSMTEKEGVDEERMDYPERRKKERRTESDRRKSERSTGVKRRKTVRRKSR